MKLTAHYEDGTTQTWDCPDWATYVHYVSNGEVRVTDGNSGIFNRMMTIGYMRLDQRLKPGEHEAMPIQVHN